LKLEPNWMKLRRDEKLRKNLEFRARTLRKIREFFHENGFLEVDPPVLVPLPGMEPHLDPMGVDVEDRWGKRRFFLHTSPEYCIKKLLSGGMEKAYALTHAFRGGEVSETHNPEFTILEWYRANETYERIMEDCEELIWSLVSGMKEDGLVAQEICPAPPWPRVRLKDAMAEYAGIDLDGIERLEELVSIARAKGFDTIDGSWSFEDVFYRIFFREVEPKLPKEGPFFLVDYPVEMGSLAKRKDSSPRWVERFELYVGQLELANGFSELIDPVEQEERLRKELEQRRFLAKELYPVDESFLEALKMGLPPCAGVALGVDRLIMFLVGAKSIREVMPFPWEDLLRDWGISYGESSAPLFADPSGA